MGAALTRDGLERTDILAVMAQGEDRRLVEIQVKGARGRNMKGISWPLGAKSQPRSMHEREFFVMVAIPTDTELLPRSYVVPRSHVAAAAWIAHMHWLTEPGIPPGQRNAAVDRARVSLAVFERCENRWDFLLHDQGDLPVLLPAHYRELAMSERVGLPLGHEWAVAIPDWA